MACAAEYKGVAGGGIAHNHCTALAVHGARGGGDAEVRMLFSAQPEWKR